MDGSESRDLAGLVVLDVGRLVETGDLWEPYRLLDVQGAVVEPVRLFLADLHAADRSVATLKSYGNDLLLWWRWLTAVGVSWNQATQLEGRDFARWMKIADKPVRAHWRYQDGRQPPAAAGTAMRASGAVNPVTGKAGRGRKYAPSTSRRALRPSEEYRTPTDEEWDEFLGHFQRRKVALGDCGRAYGTSCQHEHSCVRCPLLRIDPAQKPRLVEIRDNLTERITEAEQQGWLGEAEGLRVSLAAAEDKLAQLDERSRRARTINLGIPTFSEVAGRTAALPEKQER